MKINFEKLTSEQLKLIESLNTPEKIQKFVDESIKYDPIREDRSVDQVINDRMGECFNGALFACACLMYHGYETSIIELLAKKDEEHILCVFKEKNGFGAIAQSKYLGLKGRYPRFLSIRELVVSYMEFYFAWDGRYSLQSYTEWIDLAIYKNKWLFDPKTVIQIGKDLRNAKHVQLVDPSEQDFYATPERFWNEVRFIPEGTEIPEKYLQARKSLIRKKK